MYRSLNESGSGKINAPDLPDARFKANPYPF